MPVRPSEALVGILRRCCFRSHIRLRVRTAWYGCTLMVWSNNSQDSTWTPCDARTRIVRVLHWNLQCFSYPVGLVRGPCGTRKGAVRHPYWHVRKLTQPEFAKIPHGRRNWLYGTHVSPLRSLHGLFTGCLRPLNPYGPCKLIMNALKLYWPRTGRQNSYGPRVWTYDFCSKRPLNSPGVWCDWGITPR